MQQQCPSCGSSVDVATTPVCPNCAWSFAPAGSNGTSIKGQSVIKPAPRPKVPVEVDLVVDIDITESSRPFALGIQANCEALFRAIEAKAKGVRIWTVSHGDEDTGQSPTVITDGCGVNYAVTAIKALTFQGGGDPPEHHLDAIEFVLRTVPFTSDPRRARSALVSFTTADSKPARSGRSPQQIGDDLRARGIITCLVCESAPSMEAVGTAAQGFVFRIDPNPSPAEMQKVAAQVAASIVASIGTHGTVPMSGAARAN